MFLEGNKIATRNHNLGIRVVIEIPYCRFSSIRTCPIDISIISVSDVTSHYLGFPIKIQVSYNSEIT